MHDSCNYSILAYPVPKEDVETPRLPWYFKHIALHHLPWATDGRLGILRGPRALTLTLPPKANELCSGFQAAGLVPYCPLLADSVEKVPQRFLPMKEFERR